MSGTVPRNSNSFCEEMSRDSLNTVIYRHLPSFTVIYRHLPAFTAIYRHLPAFTGTYHHSPSFAVNVDTFGVAI